MSIVTYKEKKFSHSLPCAIHEGDTGSFALLGVPKNSSHYHGIFLFDSRNLDLMKAASFIGPSQQPLSVDVLRNCTYIKYPTGTARISFEEGIFVYEFNGEADIFLDADLRHPYNLNTDGREHKLSLHHSHNHSVELTCQDKSVHILSTIPPSRVDDWIETETSFDEARGGAHSWWSYRCLKYRCVESLRLTICLPSINSKASKIIGSSTKTEDLQLNEPAYDLACKGLQSLIVHHKKRPGILAGHPWFFQIWSRDEAIAVGGLLAQQKYETVKEILLREISFLSAEGELPNRFPPSKLGSADALGWWSRRVQQLLEVKSDIFSSSELSDLLSATRKACGILSSKLSASGLLETGPQETWMDTHGGTNDTRQGACIEIQALFLSLLKTESILSEKVSEEPVFGSVMDSLHESVIEHFLDSKSMLLKDRSNDSVVRPNVFIAWYVFPDLLSDEDWLKVLKNTLNRLLSPWGGIGTIEASSDLFQSEHTGSEDASYHRGDCWYWINNIAAIACFELGHELEVVGEHLLRASLKDLFELGALGCCSEISGYSRQEAFGCWNQAWSAATLIEAILSSR